MKRFVILVFISSLFLMNLSCGENYLDIVPEERETEEDAFTNPSRAKDYLYSIYSYIPTKRNAKVALDLFTTDEITTVSDFQQFGGIQRGEYTASDPIIAPWNDLYKGIRQAYIYLQNVDDVADLSSDKKRKYKAEAKFLIAYFHYELLRDYGPVPIAKEMFDPNTPPEEYDQRPPLDSVVNFITDELDESVKDLPEKQGSANYGRATKTIAKSVKAKMLLYVASPLFNGGGSDKQSLFDGFTNQEGDEIIPTTYDKEKWKAAAEANKEAIESAISSGHKLYENSTVSTSEPEDPVEKDLRYIFIDRNSKEVIWAETRPEGADDYQTKMTPYIPGQSFNGDGVPIHFLEKFYSKNGLPINKDPEYDYENRFDIESTDLGNTWEIYLNREPRFNAWIAYHNSYYEIPWEGENKVLMKFRRFDEFGMQNRDNDYSIVGNLTKKGVAPDLDVESRLQVTHQYPWPIIRLAELYLDYAEALIEYGEDFGTAKEYINKVRERAGIPDIDEAWDPIGGANNQSILRNIVRRERTIELFLENSRFWDLRRWQEAEVLGETVQGHNVSGETNEDFFQVKDISLPRSFDKSNYLLPIPQHDIDRNENLKQNPGY